MARVILFLVFVFAASQAHATDRHEGYYYPQVTSTEVFKRTLILAPEANRDIRVRFINQIVRAQLAAPETPRFSIFAKGSDADKMIIIALDDEIFRTLFRARGVMAQLTANMRNSDFFSDTPARGRATWYDLIKILGFQQLVISDGTTWSHRVLFQPPS